MGWDGAVLIYLFQFSSSDPLLAESRVFLLLRPGEPYLPTPGRPDPGHSQLANAIENLLQKGRCFG